MLEDIMSLVFSIIGIVLVLFLTYFGSKFLVKKMTGSSVPSKYINIIDKLVVSQDKVIMIVEVGGEKHLLGISGSSINYLTKLEDELKPVETTNNNSDFAQILMDKIKNKEFLGKSKKNMESEK